MLVYVGAILFFVAVIVVWRLKSRSSPGDLQQLALEKTHEGVAVEKESEEEEEEVKSTPTLPIGALVGVLVVVIIAVAVVIPVMYDVLLTTTATSNPLTNATGFVVSRDFVINMLPLMVCILLLVGVSSFVMRP